MSRSNFVRIAHRGASGLAPENTLRAFSKALEIGVDGVELDVRGTLDGELVVLHDQSLDRTTDRTGCIHEMSLTEIREADAGSWFGRAHRWDIPFTGSCFCQSDVISKCGKC